ncbi:MAG: hypothetical protein HW416_1607 [Chloroflexi bacterium]|nr:hypothetical protein [Chloroflexota bacterium]
MEASGEADEFGPVRTQMQLEFINHLSHDLRTPLTAIKASIGVVLANEPPGITEPLHRMLRNVDASADQMNHMVVNLVELALVVTGGLQIRPIKCDLVDVARRAAEGVGAQFDRRRQRLEVTTPKSVEAEVDASRIERVLWNLLENAGKFGQEGGTAHLQLDQKGNEAVFTVEDDGPGMAPQFQKLLTGGSTHPGQDAQSERWPGLGLVTSRFIVEALGGHISCACSTGGGSLVSLAVPIRAPLGRPVVHHFES